MAGPETSRTGVLEGGSSLCARPFDEDIARPGVHIELVLVTPDEDGQGEEVTHRYESVCIICHTQVQVVPEMLFGHISRIVVGNVTTVMLLHHFLLLLFHGIGVVDRHGRLDLS